MKTRCSSIDLLLGCPTSQQPTDTPYRSEVAQAEANLGTAKHKLLALTSRGEPADPAAIAHEYNVPEEELRHAHRSAGRVLEEAFGWFPVRPLVLTEQAVEGQVARGSADAVLLTYHDAHQRIPYGGAKQHRDDQLEQLVVIDWKTGWGDDEHPGQLAGYASAARATFGMPSSGHLTVVEAWLRHNERRVRNYTAADLDEFEGRVAAAHEHIGKVVKPHAGCRWCPRQLTCEPRHDYVRAAAMAISPIQKGVAITREQLGGLYDQYRALMAAARLYEKMLKEELEIAPIPLPGGKSLALVASETRALDAAAAWPVLQDRMGFNAAELRECVSISKTAIERVARVKAGKGKGAELMRQITSELDFAKAWVTETRFEKAVIDPPKPSLEEQLNASLVKP